MSDELMPCPFCGAPAKFTYISKKRVFAGCTNRKCPVGVHTANYATDAEAAEAWNSRAERTCHVTFERIFDEYPYEAPHCSECGQFFAGYVRGKWPRYCPNCGAKVVEE